MDQANAELKIYSAEHFAFMSAVFGFPKKLWFDPVDRHDPKHLWEGTDAESGGPLNCHHVCTFTTAERRKKSVQRSNNAQTLHGGQ